MMMMINSLTKEDTLATEAITYVVSKDYFVLIK